MSRHEIIRSLKTIIISLLIGLGAIYVSAQTAGWTPAPANPPSNNTPPPLNVSPTNQIKVGSLSFSTLFLTGLGASLDDFCIVDTSGNRTKCLKTAGGGVHLYPEGAYRARRVHQSTISGSRNNDVMVKESINFSSHVPSTAKGVVLHISCSQNHSTVLVDGVLIDVCYALNNSADTSSLTVSLPTNKIMEFTNNSIGGSGTFKVWILGYTD
jgi:hypothetical protein